MDELQQGHKQLSPTLSSAALAPHTAAWILSARSREGGFHGLRLSWSLTVGLASNGSHTNHKLRFRQVFARVGRWLERLTSIHYDFQQLRKSLLPGDFKETKADNSTTQVWFSRQRAAGVSQRIPNSLHISLLFVAVVFKEKSGWSWNKAKRSELL